MPDFKKAIRILTEENKFYLISHILPDGDSIGSLLALGEALQQQGKQVKMVVPGEIPAKYQFLKGSETVSRDLPYDGSSVAVALDCSDLSRAGKHGPQVAEAPVLINIDHHLSNQHFGTVNLVDSGAAATGEIIFSLLSQMEVDFTPSMATALYVALATDSGSFKYDNTTANTHRTAAALIDRGCRPGEISRRLFELRSRSHFLLLKQALSTLEFYYRRQVAVLTVSRDMLERCRAKEEDMDGIVNYSHNIEGVEIGLLLYTGSNEKIKIGFRSTRVDVSKLAEKFSGGGHARAAGCRIAGNYPQVKEKVLREAKATLIASGLWRREGEHERTARD